MTEREQADIEAAVRQWTPLILLYGEANGVPGSCVAATIHVESAGKPRAKSSAGALGLMQGLPDKFAPGDDPFDPNTNLLRLVPYLAGRWRAWSQNWTRALAAYLGAVNENGDVLNYETGDGPDYVNRWWTARLLYLDLDDDPRIVATGELVEHAPGVGTTLEAAVNLLGEAKFANRKLDLVQAIAGAQTDEQFDQALDATR